ncbi:MAG: hypothetical protein FWG23_06360 [Eggerthellaceae bacterium]|nr:hypothetical protein [Eggerthellaceae bacterium]
MIRAITLQEISNPYIFGNTSFIYVPKGKEYVFLLVMVINGGANETEGIGRIEGEKPVGRIVTSCMQTWR